MALPPELDLSPNTGVSPSMVLIAIFGVCVEVVTRTVASGVGVGVGVGVAARTVVTGVGVGVGGEILADAEKVWTRST